MENINFLLVFLEGVLSFLSPCVLPLIPIYIGYLAGNGKKVKEDGTIIYERKTVFINTVLFVLGISFTFFLLGMSFSVIGSFFREYKQIFTNIAGVIILLMGLIQLGVLKIPILEKEHKIPFFKKDKKVTPIVAFIMGFTFSFAWTPCIGPALASVLALASSSSNILMGNLLVLGYAIGFLIPFLLLGLFTTKVLNFFKEKKKIVSYTIKISGIILIIMGLLTFTGMTNKLGGMLANLTNNNEDVQEIKDEDANKNKEEENNQTNNENNVSDKNNDENNEEDKNSNYKKAPDFKLEDQYGNTHILSNYKGKVVFLNFWATWCPPCKEELPDIQEIYKEYGENKEDVIILGVTNPKTDKYPYSQDQKTKEEITKFLKEYKVTYPVLFDESGKLFSLYGIQAFPTTFMINENGEVYGYVPGALTKEGMKQIIEETKKD